MSPTVLLHRPPAKNKPWPALRQMRSCHSSSEQTQHCVPRTKYSQPPPKILRSAQTWKSLKLLVNLSMVKRGRGKINPRPIFWLPFQNRIELTKRLWWLFLDMVGLRSGTITASILSPRNPRWRPKVQVIFEKVWKTYNSVRLDEVSNTKLSMDRKSEIEFLYQCLSFFFIKMSDEEVASTVTEFFL